MPPNSTAAKSPVRQRDGRAGRNGQQTTGPHAPTANLTVLSGAVLMAFVLASDAAGVLSQLSRRIRTGAGRNQPARSPARMARQPSVVSRY